MAMDIFKEFYPKLLQILPVDCLITEFYSMKLLSAAHKSKLDDLSTNKTERIKYFLDEVIEPGLKVDYTEQFDEMLAIIAKSDDPPVKFLADTMKKSRGVTPPSTMEVDHQARSQDTKSQGNILIMVSCTWPPTSYIPF